MKFFLETESITSVAQLQRTWCLAEKT